MLFVAVVAVSFCDYPVAVHETFRLTDLLNDDPARKPVTRTTITTATTEMTQRKRFSVRAQPQGLQTVLGFGTS